MKMRKKSDLPSKLCVTCGLAFSWRKKWEKEWGNVKYCSERCRRSVSKNNKNNIESADNASHSLFELA